ncbi:hypothetical protein [Cohnella algarum]|uniref:hypothetical protein n=1 Tax=Cohnella algarum TaxID=2044859 RepID=UPI001967F4EA|nr:hypothetical protein [Cohnella algarum]MBN2980609.1 hypothetical protein [Cohnella algarum]
MTNVLVFPANTEAALEINLALGKIIHFHLFGVGDSNCPDESGQFIFVNYIGNLNMNEDTFVEQMNELIIRHSINIIFPASPEALTLLAFHRLALKAEVIAPEYQTIVHCLNNEKTNAMFKEFLQLYGKDDLKQSLIYCLTDGKYQLRFISNIEEQLQSVEIINRIHTIAYAINSSLRLRGPWSFQVCFLENGKLTGLKIIPGIVPSMSACRMKGVNLAALSVFDHIGHEIEVNLDHFSMKRQKLTAWRYQLDYEYDDVYMDLDETILIRGQVNPIMMAFLFQCRNKGKRVHLITKHRYNLKETLEKYGISALFETIIWLKQSDEKCRHMKKKRAIFIDDAYSERKKVSLELGIPTFEVSAVESLIDWRL